ncbi:FkbM family methyltransferase [Candidatus Nitrosotenuis chungbukensis]|uniref:FkbM family methyltransferase n=2 Tax=Candidatus Nitrosotenuis chungbukensis TaxID=1353246 RepID=UPI0005B2568F|nr:FkbM family methyltransferase [Candidatus Nitrosotenuis chungbukensis]
MSASLLEKARILIKAIKTIKNWHLYVALYLNLVKNEHIILETRNGVKIKLRVNSTDLMAFTHVWLLHEYGKPGFEIRDADIVIDVGAHIGLFALFSSQFCKNGKIYCFEPVKENFDLLEMNLEINNIRNVVATNAAVSTNTGIVTIYLNEDESGHSMHVTGSKQIQAKSLSLQDVFVSNKLERCDFLKIDCEGEEYKIIDSLSTQYFDKINKMCIEYHFADTRPQLLQDMIKKLRLSSYIVDIRNILPSIGFLYAKKR